MVFDDLNWAEPTLLDLVEHIAEWSRDAPILLVAMARPDLLDTRRAWGGGKRNATTMYLEPLSAVESQQLLEGLLGGGVVAPDVAARIQEAAEGNPLFVEEMVSILIDGEYLQRENGSWVATGDLARVTVPSSIQVLLASRLDQLSADDRQVIERAAVEGTVFHRSAVEAMLGDDADGRAADALQSLVRKELIRQERGSVRATTHTASATCSSATRRTTPCRSRCGPSSTSGLQTGLRRRSGVRQTEVEEVLGYHLEQAFRHRTEVQGVDDTGSGLAARGGRLLASAGRRAVARGDAPAAVNLLERAGALLPEDAA